MVPSSHSSRTWPRIQVLLATYNGARFLHEQIRSVLAQEDVSVSIVARDDGSSDGTQDLLAEFAREYPGQFQLVDDGVSTGSARGNFAQLIRASDAPYAAFCDQDDVWVPDKLSLSMAKMQGLEHRHGVETPLLVYTDLKVVNEELRPISESLWHSNSLGNAQAPTLARLLSENVVTGCTALLNRPLINRMKAMPPTAQMHDHWAAIVASSLGAMAAVPEQTVLYRQHESNVVGAVIGQRSFSTKLARFVSAEGVAARRKQYNADRTQAQSLLELHGSEMSPDRRQIVEGFLELDRMPRFQKLMTTTRLHMWRADRQRRIAQFLDIMRAM